MSGIFIGDTPPTAIYVGDTLVQAVYVGDELVWPTVGQILFLDENEPGRTDKWDGQSLISGGNLLMLDSTGSTVQAYPSSLSYSVPIQTAPYDVFVDATPTGSENATAATMSLTISSETAGGGVEYFSETFANSGTHSWTIPAGTFNGVSTVFLQLVGVYPAQGNKAYLGTISVLSA
jgi:hypothetical protein